MAKEEVVEEVIDDETPVVEEDSFENAFDEAVAGKGGEEEITPTKDPVELEGEAKEEPTPEEAKSEEEAVKEEEKPVKGEVDVSRESKVEAPDDEETIDQLRHKYNTLQGMYNSEVKKTKEAPKEEVQTELEKKESEIEVAYDTSALTDAIGNLESVKKAKEDYGDDVGNAFSDVANFVVKNVMGEVSKIVEDKIGKISEVVKPLEDNYAAATEKAHDDAIIEAHPDYSTYLESGELIQFIEGQKGLTLKLYQNVVESGNASDVIELVQAFRESKGYVEEKEKEPETPKKEIDTSKLEDMEAVSTKKTPVTGTKGGADKNDFGGAFQEAVNS